LKATLTQVAWAAVRKKDSFWGAKLRKLRSRLGPKKAIIVIARKILVTCYYVLKEKSPYKELGANYIDERAKTRKQKYHIKQLKDLGFEVSLTTVAQ